MDTKWDRFDAAIIATMAVLVTGIVLVIAAGDRAGVGITAMLPQGQAHTTSSIHITFAEPMDITTVAAHFKISPEVEGKLSWNGAQLTFTPQTGFSPNQQYTVTVQAGARSTSGRSITQDAAWTFQVTSPRVIYLAPAVREPPFPAPNLWMVDPTKPDHPIQLTFSKIEVVDFQPSPDGTRIAYSQKAEDSTVDIYVLTLDGGQIQQVTRCIDATCESPNWSPDGTRLVYERISLNQDLPDSERGLPRAWVVNLSDLSTAPLVADAQALGHDPQWSPDGSQIAVYDQRLGAIAVYNLGSGTNKIIQTDDGINGVFDPVGGRLLYPVLQQTPNEFVTELALADLAHPENGTRPLDDSESGNIDDRQPAWSPDGKQVALLRRYLDDRGTYGPQVYLMTLDNNQVTPLVVDANYVQGAISWNPAGDQLLMQRTLYLDANAKPGIWIYNLRDKSLRQIADDGYLPRWLP